MAKAFQILLVFLCVVLIAPAGYAQEEEPVMALSCGKKGLTDKVGRKLEGVTLTIKQDGKTFKTITTKSNGKYDKVVMPYGHTYTITMSKSGYVTKSIFIDGKKGYFPEDIMEKETSIECRTDMIAKETGVDYTVVTKSPVAKVRIDPATGAMNFDMGYISKRANEIDKFIKGLAAAGDANDKKFNDLMTAANKAYAKGDFTNALTNFQAAKKVKPDDPNVDPKIADTENKIEELKAEEEMLAKFNAAIAAGDQLVAANKFDEGIKKYNDAKAIKAGDPLPDKKIAEANKKKAEAEAGAKDAAYAAKMKEADASFASKDYTKAKGQYNGALGIKAGEKVPTAKIKEIDGILANKAKYDALIKDADAKFASKDWEASKAKYQEAIKLIDDKHPNDQIAKIDVELNKAADEKAKRDKYDALITKADASFGGEKWTSAKADYEAALKLYDEAHPKSQLGIIADKLIAAEEDAKKEEEYNQLISQADNFYKNNDWEKAKTAYNGAKSIKADPSIDSKLADIETKIAAEKEAEATAAIEKAKRDDYDQLLSKAKGQYDSKDWQAAKDTYNKALALFDESEPKNQIAKIDLEIKKEKEANDAAAAEQAKLEEYNQIMAKAKGQFDSKDWEAAKKSYNEALGVLDKQEPKDQLVAIEAKIKEEKDQATADAAEKAKRAEYDQLLAKAKGQFDGKDWANSKATYTQALGIFDEQEPKDQIAKIDAAVKAEQDAASQADAAAKILADYNAKIALADAARDKATDGPSINSAIALYKEANAIKNDETYPAAEVEKLKSKLEGIDSAQKAYDKLIAVADKKFTEGDYAKSEELFKRAEGMHPEDEYPPKKLAEITAKLKELEDKEAADAAEAAKRAKFDEFVRTGNGAFDSKQWDAAKGAYNSALGLYQDEQYPKDQLALIEAAIKAEKDALAHDAEEAAKRAKYDAFIDAGNGSFGSKSWDAAKASYNSALGLYGDEQYPKDQLAAIEAAIKAEKDALAQDAAEAEKRAKYDAFIEAGNGSFGSKSWDDAKASYNSALGLYGNEQYPKDQLTAIEAAIKAENDQAANNAAAEKILADYNAKIAEADGARDGAGNDGPKLNAAIALYKEANAIKSDETYPAAEVKKLNDRLAVLEGAKAAYDKLIAVADTKRDSKDYTKALSLYKRATGMKPNDPYPPAEIAKIEAIQAAAGAESALLAKYNAKIAQADAARGVATDGDKIQKAINLYKEANAIKSDETYPAEEVAKLQTKLDAMNDGAAAYNKLLAVADKKFDSEDYTKAISLYERAEGMKPSDTYPPQRIREINKILRDKADKDKLVSSFQEIVKRADAAFAEEDYRNALKDYNLALGIVPGSVRPTKQIEIIKALINAKADAEAEAALANKKVEVFNASEFYGEDITGNYTDGDLDKMFADAKVTHDQWRDIELEKNKTSEILMKEEMSENSRNLSDENFQNYEEIKQKYADEETARDIPREAIVDQIDAFIDKEEDKSAADQARFNDRTLDTYEETRKYVEREAKDSQDKTKSKEKNAEEYEKYKDKLVDWKTEEVDDALSRTEAEYADNEDYRRNATGEKVASIERRDRTAEVNANDNVKVDEWNRDHQEKDDTRDYAQFEAQEQYKEDVATFFDEADGRREEFVDKMEKYKEQDRDLHKDQNLKNVDRTHSTHEAIENEVTRLTEEEIALEQPRLKSTPKYDEYKDKLADATFADNVEGAEKTYGQYVETENYKTRVADEFTDADIQRQKNVDAVERTQDALNATDTEEQTEGFDRTYKQHMAKEDFDTKNQDLLRDADLPRQKTVDEVTKTTDKLADADIAKKEGLDDVFDERRKVVEANDNISDTQFTEDLENGLALKYGPGIHEKVYQRKDKRGNVMQVTIVRVVVIDGKGHEYKRIKSRFAEQYFKDGKPITETIWDTETSRASE